MHHREMQSRFLQTDILEYFLFYIPSKLKQVNSKCLLWICKYYLTAVYMLQSISLSPWMFCSPFQQDRLSFNTIWIFVIKTLIYHFLKRIIMLSWEDSELIWNTCQPQRKSLQTVKIIGKIANLFTNFLAFCLYTNTTMIFDLSSFPQHRQTSFELLFCCNVTIPLLWPLVSCKIQ